MPQANYTEALLAQLRQVAKEAEGWEFSSIFIGGGTPSLIDPEHIDAVLSAVKAETTLSKDLEVTLEANPGTVDEGHFAAYLDAGVNRISIGVQSFNDDSLNKLGRVHNANAAKKAIQLARNVGFNRTNIDLMYGLPGQTAEMAVEDLAQALVCDIDHISLYQLTIEPNTQFAVNSPALPDDEACWDMHLQLMPLLANSGFDRYEVSAFAKSNQACRHNLNYWNFGDYLAIGAGGHAKLSQDSPKGMRIKRYWNKKHPVVYIDALKSGEFVGGSHLVKQQDILLEFMMNALRLKNGFNKSTFHTSTGLSDDVLEKALKPFAKCNWLEIQDETIKPTALGYRYIDEILETLLPQ